MKNIDISLCVTTYKRPQMLKQTIESFSAQNMINSEMIIIDDCSNDETEAMVKKMQKKDSRIYYEKNKKNLGYCKNVLKSLQTARGKYLVTLGDDDILLGRDVLKTYYDMFQGNKNVVYTRPNVIQFNNSYNVDYVYKYFSSDITYTSGKQALENIWLLGTYFGGVGLRNSSKIEMYYPKDDILFPMIEVIGKLLLSGDGFGLEKYCVGMRVHEDQLGFHVMKKKRTVGRERNAYIELYEISDRIAEFIQKKNIPIKKTVVKTTVRNFLKSADKTTVISDATHVDKATLITNIKSTMKAEKRVKHTFFYWFQVCIALILPQFFLQYVKEFYRMYLRMFYWKEEILYFGLKTKEMNIHYAK